MIIVSTVLICAGMFFMAVSALGLMRLPGLYTRAHAVAKSETLALLLVLTGLLFRPEIDLSSGIRVLLILGFSLVANATAVHALLRAARRAGVQPWKLGDPAEPEAPDDDHAGPDAIDREEAR